jgi:hypothetical protein
MALLRFDVGAGAYASHRSPAPAANLDRSTGMRVDGPANAGRSVRRIAAVAIPS